MNEQFSLFDIPEEAGKVKPFEYNWKRFVGQKVRILGKVGTIVEVDRYYTYIVAGGQTLAGTPTTCAPFEERGSQ